MASGSYASPGHARMHAHTYAHTDGQTGWKHNATAHTVGRWRHKNTHTVLTAILNTLHSHTLLKVVPCTKCHCQTWSKHWRSRKYRHLMWFVLMDRGMWFSINSSPLISTQLLVLVWRLHITVDQYNSLAATDNELPQKTDSCFHCRRILTATYTEYKICQQH